MALPREPNAEPIPGYRLIERLGGGGFGEVWKCVAPGGLYKAVKFVNGNLKTLDGDGVRAEQELNALQRVKTIRHPFILSMERVEIVDGELLIVMELADKSLYDRQLECQQQGLSGIPRDELLAYMRDAAEALDLMNVEHDLQHLDIKPRDLFLVYNRVKVADFGLVKDLEGMANGQGSCLLGGITPLYASPEAFQGIISRHSDQYSLAIVYQELLTGHRPFEGKTPRQLMLQHTQEKPNLSYLADGEAAIVGRALAKDPRQRFASCMDFVRALVSGQVPDREPVAAALGARRRASMTDSMEDVLLHTPEPAPTIVRRNGDIDRSPVDEAEEFAQLSVTVAQPLTGSLKPTLVIGVGGFGRRVLQALRCRFIDRFGNLSKKLPLLRFLYIDTDQGALERAQQGPPEQALTSEEVYHLPFQGIGHHRRNRMALEKLREWLPLEKLYAITRSLETHGSRALGRLALAENYMRLAARLKRELQLISKSETIFESVNRSGLALRSDTPQVYLLAAAGGGTGSGMIIDLGYAVRRLLNDLRHPTAEVNALLMCGAPRDPATPQAEQANLYATLTEVHHFSDPGVVFSAEYGVDGPHLRDSGPPFQSTYLVRLPHRSPEELKQAATRMASYLFHDLSTPLGIRLAQSRHAQAVDGDSPFRSFGSYAIWFPRGLLLRVAARQACQRLMDFWQSDLGDLGRADVAHAGDQVFADFRWRPELIRQHIDQSIQTGDGGFHQGLMGFFVALEGQAEQSVAREDPVGWCREALERLGEWVSSSDSEREDGADWRRSRLHRHLAVVVQKLADEQFGVLAKVIRDLFDRPGYRLAAVEAALDHFARRLAERLREEDETVADHAARTAAGLRQVEHAVQACLAGGGFSLFGGNRTRKHLRSFVDKLMAYSRLQIAEESARAVQQLSATVRARLHDLRRDLALCQQRLRHLSEALTMPAEAEQFADRAFEMEAGTSALALTATPIYGKTSAAPSSRIVLPGGAADMDTAAREFLDSLADEHWARLDDALQSQVLVTHGGLYRLCMTSGDLTRTLSGPMLEATAEYLGQQLPITDVCAAQLSAAEARRLEWSGEATSCFALAEPSLASLHPDREQGFLLVPSSDGGRKLADAAKAALSHLVTVRTLDPNDLLFCREQTRLGLEDVQELLGSCKSTYLRHLNSPPTTPHARCDIHDWVPLDP